ncbi:MAG: type II toxin-antitoxin system Phd/YefM family antitoxin [bacterium]
MLRAMPTLEFINQIDELSEFCRNDDDPIILTRQGRGDLVVMGMEAYNKLFAKLRLLRDVADANARLVEGENPADEELIDQAMQIVHDKIQSRLRLSDVA